jgi:hypothetical protein
LRANRQARTDIALFQDLIDAPHDLGNIDGSGADTPFTLPGNGRLAVSSSDALLFGGLTVTIGERNEFGIPALDADEVRKGTYGAKDQVVDITVTTATGDLSLYFVDEFGKAFLIATGTLSGTGIPEFLLQENGDKILQEDGSGILL